MEVPAAEWTIPLHRAGRQEKLAHHVIFGLLWLLGLLIAAGGASALIEDTAGKGLLPMGVVILGVTEIARRLHLREVAPGRMTIKGTEVTIVDPQLLKAPLVVPVRNIRVAALDEGAAGQERTPGRFPVLGDEDGPLAGRVRGHLTAEGSPAPLRLLRRSAYDPNLVLLFDEPVVVAGVRREVEHGPQDREALGGLALHTEDSPLAREAFAAMRIRPVITEADGEHLWSINRGVAIPAESAALSFDQAERRKIKGVGWAFILGGLLLPPGEIGGLLTAYVIWREGLRAQAVAMGFCAAVVLAFHIWVVTNPPVEQWWRFVLGVPATIWVVVRLLPWLEDPEDPHRPDAVTPGGGALS